MLDSSLKIRATHLPEKIHCNVAFSPITALGLFFQIACKIAVLLCSTIEKKQRFDSLHIENLIDRLQAWYN